MKESKLAWLAGIIEGEGCIAFTGRNSVMLTVNMTDEDVVRKCLSMARCGKIRGPYRLGGRGSPIWSWGVGNEHSLRRIIPLLIPWLGRRRSARAEQAMVRLSRVRRKGHCKRGHRIAGANRYVAPDGRVYCRECHRIHDRIRNATERRRAMDRARDADPKRRAQKRAAMARYMERHYPKKY